MQRRWILCRRSETGVKLAVVIPVYARTPREVAQLLTALWKLHLQTRPADAVYLVDDGSPLPMPPNLGNDQVCLRPPLPVILQILLSLR